MSCGLFRHRDRPLHNCVLPLLASNQDKVATGGELKMVHCILGYGDEGVIVIDAPVTLFVSLVNTHPLPCVVRHIHQLIGPGLSLKTTVAEPSALN